MSDVLDTLTQDQLLQILADNIGLRFEIPDILTFIDDDYYLGGVFYNKHANKSRIYPIWRDRLQEIFPNPLTTKSSYITVSGCIGCLTGDTEIETLNGTKTFKELKELWDSQKESIYVMAANTEKQTIEADKVVDVFISGKKQVYEITLDNGLSFKCTSNHQFLSKDNKWISLDSGLCVGLALKATNYINTVMIITKIEKLGIEEVYDLTTENHHNFALTCGIFAHNSGKSTFSQIVLMYDYLKLLAMIDPGEFFELINLTGIWMFGSSFYKYKAEEFMVPIKAILKECPFIQDLKKQGMFNDNIKLASAYGKHSIVSTDAAFIWLSEVNEYRKPDDMISSSLSRMRGRFQKGLGLFNHFILDCSDTTVDSATERFIHDSPYSDELVSYKADIWTVKPHLYWNMNPKGFYVYAGDSQVVPHILGDDEDTSCYDEDRILYVPSELRSNYELDIDKALQETAGVALVSGGMFFPDDYIQKFFCLPQLCKEIEVIDQFDDTRIIDLDYVSEAIEQLPESRYLFIGLDAGYATDHYGIAIGYADSISYSKDDENEEGAKNFNIKIPFVMGLSRKKGQQTPLYKVRDFIYDINQKRPVKMVAYDNFQTVELAQEMKLIGIDAKYITVEQDKYYILFKHGLYDGRIQVPDNHTLYREMRCLKHTDGHIDHSNVETLADGKMQRTGINAKDLSDATVRVYAAIREHLDLAVDVPLENRELQDQAWKSMLTGMQQMRNQRTIQQQTARYGQNMPMRNPFARRR